MMRSSKPKVTVDVMRRWSVNEVIDWLQKNDLVEWTKYVRNNSISGQILSELPEGRIMSAPGIPPKQKKDMMSKIGKIQEQGEKALKKTKGKNKSTPVKHEVEDEQDEGWGSDFDEGNSGPEEDYENFDPNVKPGDDTNADSGSDDDYLEPDETAMPPPPVPRRGSADQSPAPLPPRPGKSNTGKTVPPVPGSKKPKTPNARKMSDPIPPPPPRKIPLPEQETYEVPEDIPSPPMLPPRPSNGQRGSYEQEEEYQLPEEMGNPPQLPVDEEEYEIPDILPEPPRKPDIRQLPPTPVPPPKKRPEERQLPPPPIETEEEYTVPEETMPPPPPPLNRQLPPRPNERLPPPPPEPEDEEEYTVPEELLPPPKANGRVLPKPPIGGGAGSSARNSSLPPPPSSMIEEMTRKLKNTPEKKGGFLHSTKNHQKPSPIREDSQEPAKAGIKDRAKMFEKKLPSVPPVPVKKETPVFQKDPAVKRDPPPISPTSPSQLFARPPISIPTNDRPQPPVPPTFGGPPKPNKSRSSSISELRPLPPVPPIVDEEANPLYEYPWYFGEKKRDEVAHLFKNAEDGVFLVRKSDKLNQPFSLSLWYNGKCWHLPIRIREDQKYALGSYKENEAVFSTVPEMVQYHQINQLALTSRDKGRGGAVNLKRPPPRR